MDSTNPYKAPTVSDGNPLPKKPALIGPLLALSILAFGGACLLVIVRFAFESRWVIDLLLLLFAGFGVMCIRSSYSLHRNWHRRLSRYLDGQ